MALSESVQESLNEAQSALRNALAYAARQERPIVCKQIAELMANIDSINSFDTILDHLDELRPENSVD